MDRSLRFVQEQEDSSTRRSFARLERRRVRSVGRAVLEVMEAPLVYWLGYSAFIREDADRNRGGVPHLWDVQHDVAGLRATLVIAAGRAVESALFPQPFRPGPTTKEAFEATEVRLTLTRAANTRSFWRRHAPHKGVSRDRNPGARHRPPEVKHSSGGSTFTA